MAPVAPLILNTDKGWERLIVDLLAEDVVISVCTGGDVVLGKLIAFSGGVLTLEKEVTRFEKHAVYIPINAIRYIAAAK
jgi:hypothetical protein